MKKKDKKDDPIYCKLSQTLKQRNICKKNRKYWLERYTREPEIVLAVFDLC